MYLAVWGPENPICLRNSSFGSRVWSLLYKRNSGRQAMSFEIWGLEKPWSWKNWRLESGLVVVLKLSFLEAEMADCGERPQLLMRYETTKDESFIGFSTENDLTRNGFWKMGIISKSPNL
ncbi:hypothetical protein GIB67_005893 [Kingdonia uniflora]|uniref:Uncharacterized protein n=1 Tax=Kingdonia uniflora TaxID=39325 RepID=A0A7J7MBJ5_9MAGN|nr:hypothetical protein GIB67_005893 [Kingdonia uniflora]